MLTRFIRMALATMYAAPEDGAGGGGAGAAAAALTAPVGGGAGGSGQPAGGAPAAVVDPVPADAWYGKFENPEVKGWVHSLKPASAEALALKTWNLEKFLGADKAQRGVVVPKADAKPEEWSGFWTKTGLVPAKPEEYKFPATLRPEQTEALSKDQLFNGFRIHAHKSGMPQPFFEQVVNWYTTEMAGAEEKRFQEFESNGAKEFEGLKEDWKDDHPKMMELAKRSLQQFLPYDKQKGQEAMNEAVNKILGALGVKNTYHMFAGIGKALLEDDFVLGGGSGQHGEMSPEAAKAEITALKKDLEFGKKWAANDADAKAKWDRLHKIAFPGMTALRDGPRSM